jgi:hypothetical protein
VREHTSVVQLRNSLDLQLCAPFAESLRVERKLTLAVKQLVGDLAHARGIFEDHSIRTLEIEESRRGRRMPMVDVLDARSVGRKQRVRVMDLVDTQQRRVADSVAHSGVADLGPEHLIAGRVGGAESDVAESSNPGVPFSVIAPATVSGPPNEFDLVACRILEGDEAFARGAPACPSAENIGVPEHAVPRPKALVGGDAIFIEHTQIPSAVAT